MSTWQYVGLIAANAFTIFTTMLFFRYMEYRRRKQIASAMIGALEEKITMETTFANIINRLAKEED